MQTSATLSAAMRTVRWDAYFCREGRRSPNERRSGGFRSRPATGFMGAARYATRVGRALAAYPAASMDSVEAARPKHLVGRSFWESGPSSSASQVFPDRACMKVVGAHLAVRLPSHRLPSHRLPSHRHLPTDLANRVRRRARPLHFKPRPTRFWILPLDPPPPFGLAPALPIRSCP